MRMKLALAAVGLLVSSGCYVAPAPPPRERVVEREVVDSNGYVVERDTYVVDGPPPAARVEIIPVAPYPTAVWVRGYWFRDRYRHRWVWMGGHWR
jgi:hypothetical protein